MKIRKLKKERESYVPRQKWKPSNLPPTIQKLFDAFTHLANKTVLHPLDWERFYGFVRACHYHSCRPHETDLLLRLLCNKGFAEEKAEYLVSVFGHCYAILSAPVPPLTKSIKATDLLKV
jgi:hypothetical protein